MITKTTSSEIQTDVLIVGAGCGGCAAALALLRAGVSCVMTEPTAMIGGQLSSQGVPPDENPWIEGAGPAAPSGFRGCSASYAELRARIRAHYRAHESLTPEAAGSEHLNPGGGWVSRLCFEPRLADMVLRTMLLEAEDGRDLLTLLCEHAPTAAESDGDRVRAIDFVHAGSRVVLRPRLVLEATETGDILNLARIEHAIGAEAWHVYAELHARADLPTGADHDPLDQQACTWCFAVEHHPSGEYVIDKPEHYDLWHTHVPRTDPPWTGPLFSWTVPSHNQAGRIRLPLVPAPDEPPRGEAELWRYRRIVDARAHTDGRPDVSLINVVQMDFWARPLLGVPESMRVIATDGAREQARCFLYWMQTEAPRHDTTNQTGYPGLKLSGRALGSADGFALAPYIREPRRLIARTVLTEAHVGAEQRKAAGAPDLDGLPFGVAEPFTDSVAIGHYPIDLHPSCAGRNSVYVPACPFRVPLGALIPRRARNLLAAGKTLGVSHVANGCTRLHPVEWSVGEAAGVLAAMCLRDRTESHAVFESDPLIRTLQQRLIDAGVPIRWPWEHHLQETRCART